MAAPDFVVPLAPDTWRVDIWVQPGAKKNEVAGLYQGRCKVRLAAPPVDNKANKALTKFIADVLGIKGNRVRLDSGQTSRKKTLIVTSEEEPAWNGLCPGGNG